MPKKSLAREIAELMNPTPKDFDPESFSEFGEKAKTVEYDSEDEKNQISGNVNKLESKKLFLKGDISLTEGKYAGITSSRKQFFKELPSLQDNEEEDEVEDGDEENEEENENGEEDSELESDEIENEDEGESESNDSDSSEEEEDDDFETKYGDVDGYEKELQEMEELKKEQSIQLLSQTTEEKEKAQHTKNQKFIWNNVLKIRIKQQKLLTLSNKLPTFDLFSDFANYNEKNSQAQKEVSSSLQEVISSFIDLGTTFKSNNPQCSEYLPKGEKLGKKRSRFQWEYSDDADSNLSSIWNYIQQYEESFNPFIETVVDHWNKKTQLSSRISMTKFKAINQNVLSQVRGIMEDSEKLIKRTQVTKADQKIIGFPSPLPEYVPEIFDDTTFYQQLLKELIEGETSNDSEIDLTRSWLTTRDANKKRKVVDRKASKGRKLRYNVHDKLVNFAAPTEREAASYSNDLFLQLFTK